MITTNCKRILRSRALRRARAYLCVSCNCSLITGGCFDGAAPLLQIQFQGRAHERCFCYTESRERVGAYICLCGWMGASSCARSGLSVPLIQSRGSLVCYQSARQLKPAGIIIAMHLTGINSRCRSQPLHSPVKSTSRNTALSSRSTSHPKQQLIG
jgi:hypothetical protein